MSSFPQPADRAAEIRKQRHDFLLKYYDMAVKDLDRHFTQGWQTIATAAGAIATISLGYRDYLPIPLAVAAALVIAFWGMLNIIETDFWALRAIAFLANVEAVYFAEEDRAAFNPYVARHPPFKLLAILKVQFIGILCFLAVTAAFYVFNVAQRASTPCGLRFKLAAIPNTHLIYWLLPILMFAILLVVTCRARRARVAEYLQFVAGSPGPGIARSRTALRLTDLEPINPADIIPGKELQEDLMHQLRDQKAFWDWCCVLSYTLAGLVAIGTVLLLLLRHRLACS